MDDALADLIAISRQVGSDPSLVQGGGGNTSVKTADGRYMYIKASGTAIKDISQHRGWRRLRVASVCAIIQDSAMAGLSEAQRESEVVNRLRLCCEDDVTQEARPSVEAHLHAALGRCVVHLHPVAVGAFVCAKNGKAELERLFRDEQFPPLWVPAAHPGYTLAVTVCRLVDQYKRQHGRSPTILFLEKHGLFVTADDPDEVLSAVERAIGKCAAHLPARGVAGDLKPPTRQQAASAGMAIRRALWEVIGKRFCVQHCWSEDVMRFLARADAKRLASAASITPDELVYANGSPVWLNRPSAKSVRSKLERLTAAGEKPATSFLAPGIGLFLAGAAGALNSIREVVVASLLMREYAAGFGGLKPLTKRQREFIINWEAESFRQKVAGLSGDGDLAGQIAVVTGAGSGLGRSIAIGLAGAGAVVALADIDLASAQETGEMIGRQHPEASILVARCDVTDEEQMGQVFDLILERWGGLDVLVNAAGIAPPYALVELPVEKWRLALEVNLTGYFLMAKAAARAMIAQGMGGNIINISSKSGLEASRNNTPYNATKAGEIHMARGWALELGQYGIRVNSVAPGNVFAGSKIWNPQYIRECARKYGIKPEEVIPYYVSMTALKKEITGQDVANAVIFLCSERARTVTGQTLVCDAGQVMVR